MANMKRMWTADEAKQFHSFNFLEVLDVMRLIKNGEMPDGRFSDDECSLYSALESIMEHGDESSYVPYWAKSNK